MPNRRYKLTIAYRGTRYHGWQRQAWLDTYKGQPGAAGGIPSIQEAVSDALQQVVRHQVNLVGSSRTDAFVHAKGQVAHFDTDQLQIPMEGLRRATNARLPEDILIRRIEAVSEEFDAISCTISKRYQYVVWNTEDRPLFFADLAFHRWQKLDREAMREAAKWFVGEHDFASFARPGHGRDNTVRTVHECSISWRGPMMVIGVEGSGFLWNMVRIMAGTLIEVGIGRYRAEEIATMLAAKDRRSAGSTAPPHGLYLQWIRSSETPRHGGGEPEAAE